MSERLTDIAASKMHGRMNALTLASAKHLLSQGHITPAHHARIVSAVKPRKPRAFGSLAPQQAQAPIPGAMGAAAVPAGTSTGYGSDE